MVKKIIIVFGIIFLVILGGVLIMINKNNQIQVIEEQKQINNINKEHNLIYSNPNHWNLDITPDYKEEVATDIYEINETTLEIVITEHINSTTKQGYKWAMALCGEANSNLRYLEEDAQGGFENAYPMIPNYDKLTNYGLNETWCNGGDGYILFSSGSKNQFPKRMRILTGNLTNFRIYIGTGSVVIDGSVALDSTYPANNRNMVRNSTGYLCIGFLDSGADLWAKGSGNNGSSWSGSEVIAGTYRSPTMLVDSNNVFYLIASNNNNVIVYNSTDCNSWNGPIVAMDTTSAIYELSSAIDSNNNKYVCGIDSTDQGWIVNSSSWDNEINISRSGDDMDYCDVAVDDEDYVYAVGVGASHDDLDIFSSRNGYSQRFQIDDALGSVGIGYEPSITICKGRIFISAIELSDLQVYISTLSNWNISYNQTEADNGQSFHSHIACNDYGAVEILYTDSAGTTVGFSNEVYRVNSSDNFTTWTNRTQIDPARSQYAGIASSNFPSFNRMTDTAFIYWTDNAPGNSLLFDNYSVPYSSGGAEPENDTCTYTSGSWEVDCSDNCEITDNVDSGGNNISITGTGTFTLTNANITNAGNIYIKGTDVSNLCRVYCNGGCLI